MLSQNRVLKINSNHYLVIESVKHSDNYYNKAPS